MKQSGVHLRHSTAELAKIKSIKFTLLGKEEIVYLFIYEGPMGCC
jgi:hypothetical protein